MSIIRADSIKNRAGNGAPEFPNGLTGTTGTFSGNLGVGGVLTYEDVTNIDSVGVITARSDINVAGNIKNGTSLIDITQNGRIEIDIAGTEIVDINGNGVDVVGGVDITGTLKLADTIEHSGDSNTKIRFPAADTVSFETAGSERLRVGSSGQLGIGGANYGSSGQVLTSQGSGSAIQWATISTPLVAYKAKESLYTRYSFSSNSWTELKSDFRIIHTPAATGNTIIMHTQIYHTVENGSYGGFANVSNQGTGSDEAMIGESNTSNAVQKGSILSSGYHNEMIRNTNGGNMWMGTHLWGYHVTENTNAHTFKLFGRMGNGTRYVGDNQMGQLMQIWEYQGNVMQ